MAFSEIESRQQGWPAWAFYLPESLLAFSTRFVLGITFEKSGQYLGSWRSLYWRVLCFESLAWSWNMVFFLAALDASDHENGLLWLLVAGAIGFPTVALSKKLVSKFRCPHCKQFFFRGKDVKEDGGLSPFSMNDWPNTHCQHCSWPLGKITA